MYRPAPFDEIQDAIKILEAVSYSHEGWDLDEMYAQSKQLIAILPTHATRAIPEPSARYSRLENSETVANARGQSHLTDMTVPLFRYSKEEHGRPIVTKQAL